MENEYAETQLISKHLQLQLLRGDIDYNDEVVQFFLPVALCLTDFDWLRIIAENTLIEEDEKIVKNFLSKVEALAEINATELQNTMTNIRGE